MGLTPLVEAITPDKIYAVMWPIAIAAILCTLFFGVTQCATAQNIEEERTNQEAIKAGLAQGQYGRWVKPGVPQDLEGK